MKRTRHLASLERVLERKRHRRIAFRFAIDWSHGPEYYHRDGTPYAGTSLEQTLAFSKDLQEDRQVTLTRFEGGGTLSTVWLGLDHGLRGLFTGLKEKYRPVIFETMFFRTGDKEDLYQERYFTEDEAKAGHEAKLAELLARGLREVSA